LVGCKHVVVRGNKGTHLGLKSCKTPFAKKTPAQVSLQEHPRKKLPPNKLKEKEGTGRLGEIKNKR
jgi:hypothetical protein